MKRYLITFSIFFLVTFTWIRCAKNFPVDEDGLLITTRGQCYVGNFELLGADFQTVRTTSAVIDTTAPVSYTHLRAHETRHDLVCRLLLEKKKNRTYT